MSYRRLIVVLCASLFLFLSVALVPVACAQDATQIDPLAGKAATQIEKFAKKKNNDTVVLVVDFARQGRQPTELGVKLADEFADSLRTSASGFTVVDRKAYRDEITAEGITPDEVAGPDESRCVGFKLKADLIVRGTFEQNSNKLSLKVEVARPDGSKRFFKGGTQLPLTPEMQALPSTSPAATLKMPVPDRVLWVNPDHPPVSDGQAVSYKELAKRGYSYPRCASCSSATLSAQTHTVGFNATVVLMTQIDTNGFPTKITMVRGAPCDLTAKAVEVLSKWRFKPGMAPHGVPVVVEEPIEVTFHLY